MYKGARRIVAAISGRAHGFTIVETMVVLAVTGALFVAIAATLAGRQNAAEFTHAIQSVQSQIQQTINQVSTGFYPNQKNFACSASGGTVQIAAGSNAQGTNGDCVFLGKVMQFGITDTDPEAYQVYTIVGLRDITVGSGSPFFTSHPAVLGFTGSYETYSSSVALEYGLTTKWIRSYSNPLCTSPSCSIGAVAFLLEPGNVTGAGSAYDATAQPVDLVPIADSRLGQTVEQAVGLIESGMAGSGGLNDQQLARDVSINPPSGVELCFASGGSRESGLITIGGSGRQLAVSLVIKDTTDCS